MHITRDRRSIAASIVLALSLLGTISAKAEHLWIYEVADSLAFYQTLYPEGNWQPYVEALDRAKHGFDRGDDQIIMVAMSELIAMLRSHAHGIPHAAARGLYQVAVTFHPSEINLAASSIDPSRRSTRVSPPIGS